MIGRPLCNTAIALALMFTAAPALAATQACTPDDLAMAVDDAGASLRTFNAEASPKLQTRLKALAVKKGWSDQELEDNAITELQDPRLSQLDETANALLARIDVLGQLKAGETPDCSRIEEIKTAGLELLTVMKTKNGYLLARIDAETGVKTAAATPPAATVPAAPSAGSTALAGAPASPPPPPAIKDTLPALPGSQQPSSQKTAPKPDTGAGAGTGTGGIKPTAAWNATTAPVPTQSAPPPPTSTGPAWQVPVPPVDVAMVPPPPSDPNTPRPKAPMLPLPSQILASDDGYTIDEIRDATQGFFGGVSTGLAAVIEHAFQKTGRPTGYILGQEGGGAFLGGLRYGDGTLYVRTGGTQKIFWHGPSVGLDFGAAGARTMFLVYKMRDPADLYRVFTGLDGSAFVVGGVGLTLLGGGGMILAPIRSGLGVRVGANVGYLRFTPTQTWNPL